MKKTKNNFKKNILIYSLAFLILSSIIIFYVFYYNKELIRHGDGLSQHIVTLRYFRDLIIKFIRTGSISTFTWNIGLGFDLFSNLSYYILGDVFSYLSILVRTKDVELLYSILAVLRMYFIGISFLCYTKYKKMDNLPSIIGALTYTFSSFVLFSMPRHPYFLNAVILFPILMIAIEKVIVENKTTFFTFMVFISLIVSFYFGYMLLLIIALYGIILTIYQYKKDGIKTILKVLFKCLFYGILGVLLSAVVLLPTAYSFLTSERVDSFIYPYTLDYYRNIFTNILSIGSSGYWVIIGTQSIIFITLPMFIRRRKQNYPLFILLILLIIPLLFSKVGSIFDGFGYPNNRWSFVFPFIFSLITVTILNSFKSIEKKDYYYIFASIIIYFIINLLFDIRISLYTQVQIVMFFIFLFVINLKQNIKINHYNTLLLFVICLGIFFSIKYLFGVNGSLYVDQLADRNSLNYEVDTSKNTISDFAETVNYIKEIDNSFYKIEKFPFNYPNNAILSNFNTISHYYSITPNIYSSLNMDLKNIAYEVSKGFSEFDYRTKINTLLGVEYYIEAGSGIVPYGFKKVKGYNGESVIYKNKYALPFAEFYDSYITVNEYEKLSPLEKEVNLLKTTALDKKSNSLKHYELKENENIDIIDYDIIKNKELINNNIISTEKENEKLELDISTIKNGEIYLYIKGLRYEPYSVEEQIDLSKTLDNTLTLTDIAKLKHNLKWYQPNYEYKIKVSFGDVVKSKTIPNYITNAYNIDDNNYLFNLGYYKQSKDKIIISLSEKGRYYFDDIIVYKVNMDNYPEDIENLKRSNFEIVDYDDGYMKGTVNVSNNGILQFQTLYNKGWDVYVDDKKVDTIKSNKYFLGIEIEAGKHDIYLKYHIPYLKEGFILSIIGIIIFILQLIVRNIKYRFNVSKK